MPTIAEARPPYVRFEIRAEEDRNASLEAGHFVGVDVIYALITPQGSKDCVERKAEEWFDKLRQDIQEERLPQNWFDHFKRIFEGFKTGIAPPVEGFAIENWPPVSPSQLRTLREIGVRTVEDLAGANEETLNRLGMGARALKQRAEDWLATSKSAGALSGQLEALREELANLRTVNDTLKTQLGTLQATVKAEAATQTAKVSR